MSPITDVVGVIRDAIKLTDEVKRVGETLKLLSGELREHDTAHHAPRSPMGYRDAIHSRIDIACAEADQGQVVPQDGYWPMAVTRLRLSLRNPTSPPTLRRYQRYSRDH